MSVNILKNTRILQVLLFILIFTLIIFSSPMGMVQVNADTVTTTTVTVGNTPQRIVVNETTNRIYVTSGDIDMQNPVAGELTVIDGSDYSIITTSAIGGTPKGMAVDEDNNKIYVANLRSNSVMVMDGNTNAVSTLATSINRPIAVALKATSTTSALYVAQNLDDVGYGYVKVLNSSSGAEITTPLSVEKNPSALVLNASTGSLYVTHENSSGTVTVINSNSNTTVCAINVGAYPESIAVNETTNRIYVANSGSDTVSVIDGSNNTVIETIPVGDNPWGVAVNETTNKIYVANQVGRSVSVIDGTTNPNTVVQTLTVPDSQSGPIAVAVDQTHNKIYVSSIGTHQMTVIDGSVIEAASITGLTAPAVGETPDDTLIPGDGRYTVTGITWKNLNDGAPATLSSGNFANAGNTYKAEIVLTANSNYKFPSGLTPTVNAGSTTAGAISGDALGNTLTFEVTFPVDIATTSLGGLAAPAAGATPAAISDLTSGNSAQYAVTSLTWENSTGSPATLDDSGKYKTGGSSYRARVVLMSQTGYKFPAGGLTPDVDGDGTATAGTVSGGNVSGNTLTFSVTFSEEITNEQATIFGLAPPEAGATPQNKNAPGLTPNISTCCTISALTWQNSGGSPATLSGGAFITGGSTYKAVIELTSLEGYKFPLSGLTPDVNDDGIFLSGAVSGGYEPGNQFTFEVAFSSDITSAAISGLVAPAAGAEPVTKNDLTVAHPLYNVDGIDWYNPDYSVATLTDDKFNTNSAYIALIYLKSNSGYKFPFDGVTATVNTGTPGSVFAPSSYTSGNTIGFEVVFPTTGAVIVDTGNSSGSGSGGGGGGGTSQGDSETNSSGNTTTATTTVTAKTDSSGNTTASVLKTQVNDAINKAVTAANKIGSDANAVVEIKVEAPAASKSVTTSIPKDAVGLAVSGGTDELKVSTPVASLSFDTAALSTIFGEAAGDVNITASEVDAASLPDETRQLVGDRPVFNFSVTSGNQTISQFGGNVTASVPYTPKAGEDTDAIVIYYINADGKPEAVGNCKYDPVTKTVSFTTNHFSQYAVGYNKVSFSDVKAGAWYENAVEFVAARGIVTGTGNGNYDPAGKLTRGQLLVMLMRAYAIEPDTDLSDNFADAGNTYYTGYLAAAKRLGITEGLRNNLYAPNANITRQEMFTLLYNTLKVIDKLPEGSENAGESISGYNDAGSIATWAKDATGVLAEAGIISGNNGHLSPKSTTTRAEMAQVLYNLLSK